MIMEGVILTKQLMRGELISCMDECWMSWDGSLHKKAGADRIWFVLGYLPKNHGFHMMQV